jgi:hypothetical protein
LCHDNSINELKFFEVTDMGVPITFLSANSLSSTKTDLLTALNAANSTDVFLLIPWNDLKGSINSTDNPDTLEDWLSAINYALVDKCVNDSNSFGQPNTLTRRFDVSFNGKGLSSSFISGTDLITYQTTLTLYIADSSPVRPPSTSL